MNGYKGYDYLYYDDPPLDKCIDCGADSEYYVHTHIDQRIGYIDGAGQLCKGCFDKLNEDKFN